MRQFRILYREFLFRMVDLELLSSHAQGDMTKLFGQFAALLLFLSLMFSIPALGFGTRSIPAFAQLTQVWGAQHFLIATTMLAVGLFAVISWETLFPDRRDVHILAPLPVPARTMFLAKVAAAASALGLTVAILHAVAGLAWPFALIRGNSSGTVPSLVSDAAMPPVGAARMEEVLRRDFAAALASHPEAGIAVGVWTRGERSVFSFGAAKPDSIFEIGSIGKTFTGLLLAKMSLDGRVRLDEPVRELLPEGTVRRPGPSEITLVDLATQRSGLSRGPSNFQPADRSNPFADYGTERLYEYLRQRGVAKPENPRFAYSNTGFGLLGHALGVRAGSPYASLVEQEIAHPLGLEDTAVELTPAQRTRFAQGHDIGHRAVSEWNLQDAMAGAGGLRSTAGDMLTYLVAFLRPLDRFTPLTSALILSREPRADIAPGTRIALAWFHDPREGTYWHGGATGGYTADASFNPREDFALIVLSNTGPGTFLSADMLSRHIRSRMAGRSAVSIATVNVPASNGFLGFLRMFAAYWIAMLASGAFIFCCVLGAQGVAAQLLPRPWFLRVSSWIQMAAFCLLVTVYFLQPMMAGPEAILEAQGDGWIRWSPSYWFVGLFQQMNGSPALAPLARRAWIGMGAAGVLTAAAYALSYFRTLRRIVEEPDITPVARRIRWLPRFGNPAATAVVHFAVRTLLRSRQHRVIFAFYLGIAFAFAIFLLKSPPPPGVTQDAGFWNRANVPMLASTIVAMGFWVIGIRVVFALPLELRANWVFRVTPVRGGLDCLAARRRALLIIGVLPAWAASSAVLFAMWPWTEAAGHAAALGLLGVILAELCLAGVQKLPFTCSYLPGKSSFHITFWLCMGLIQVVVIRLSDYERTLLEDSARTAAMLAVLAALALAARWRASASAGGEAVQFEDAPADQILKLELGPG